MIITFDSAPGRRDEVVQRMEEILPDTKAFPGCIHVELLTVDDSETGVALWERWESDEAYAAYRAFRAESGTSVLKSDLVVGAPTTMMLTQIL